MAKFTQSVAQPGQVDEATKAIVETPVEQVKEKVPQASAFEALLSGQQEVDTTAAAAEITDAIPEETSDPAIAAQQEAERITPLAQRIEAAEKESPKWEYDSSNTGGDKNTGMQDLIDRAGDLKKKLDDKKITAGWGIGQQLKTKDGESVAKIARTQGPEAATKAVQETNPYSTGSVLSKIGALQYTDTGGSIFHSKFGGTLSAVTENYFNQAQDATPAGVPKEVQDTFTGETTGELIRPETDYLIEKAKGNDRLGREIYREFQRTLNAEAGRPTDDYQDIGYEDATVLGDMAKELFYQANPNLIKRTTGTDGRTYFRMTAEGVSVFEASRGARKRLFPTTHTRPSKTVLPKGELVGEGKKLKRTETKKAGDLGKINLINKAKENLHSVGNVVDPRRMKILLATSLPALLSASQLNVDTTWGNITGLGSKQKAKFQAAKILADRAAAKEQQAASETGTPYYPKQPL